MGLNRIVRSKGFKNFMSKLYGIGASIVILGALFKINHYNYANEMLLIGMSLEAIIFFFSAFEAPPVDPDWSLVYPELAHIYHNGEEKITLPKPAVRNRQMQSGAAQQLDVILEEAKIGPELIQSLGDGLRRFSDNTARLSNLASAAIASDNFVNNMQKASSSVEKLAESSRRTAEVLDKDSQATQEYVSNIRSASEKVADLSSVYSQATISLKNDMNATNEFAGAVKLATQSANDLAKNYNKSAESISQTLEALEMSKMDGETYNTQMKKVSSNLSALNTVYELQLQSIQQQIESTKKVQSSVGNFVENIEQSNENMTKYKEEVDMLTRKIAAMNSVYGNMLSAMNFSQK
jgi:gliding motility-associated protein GldL